MDPSQAFRCDNQVALVTGGGTGLGLAAARCLAAAGARIVITGRRAGVLEDAAREIGPAAVPLPCDVSRLEELPWLLKEAERRAGPIDILVNNAGMQRRGPLDQFDEATWHELMRTNVDSVFYASKTVAAHMIPRKRGKIINICSVQSELGRPGIAPYTASKGAVKMLTKGMAIDWGPHGIQVNGLGPGYFKTELTQTLVDNAEFTQWLVNRTPSRRWGNVEDLAGAAVFLASTASDFVNGHILYVDGGVTATL
jgi:gluconate 5-dehydrogenase